MRKLLFLFAVATLLFAGGCNRDKEDNGEKPLVRLMVTSSVSFNNEPDWVLKVQSTTFNHVYDSLDLLVTNNTTNAQSKFFSKVNTFNIALTAGNYNMYMATKDARAVESYLHFTSSTPSANVANGSPPITLTADTRQALLLVTKAAVDAAPTIQIGTKTYTMFLQTGGTFYYAYINAPSPVTVKLNMVIGGKAASRDLSLSKTNRYLVTNPVNATITNSDPITNSIQI